MEAHREETTRPITMFVFALNQFSERRFDVQHKRHLSSDFPNPAEWNQIY